MKIKPKQIDKDIERAIMMLTDCVKEKCRNQKPLILHSIRVGLKLLELGQPKEVVLAGILHDLVEDTDCTIGQIKKVFGPKVADLVLIVTQKKEENYQERWHTLMEKIIKAGKSVMILKLVDMNENLTYVPLVKNHEELKKIKWKYDFGMNKLKPYLKNMNLFQECQDNYKKLFKRLRVN